MAAPTIEIWKNRDPGNQSFEELAITIQQILDYLSSLNTTDTANTALGRSAPIGFVISGGVTIGAGVTTYGSFFPGAFGTTNFNSTEANRQGIVPFSGTVRNLYVKTSGAQPASGSLVFTVRKNGSDTALTLTIPASGAAGNYSDTSNSFTVEAGDLINIKAVNNATGVSATITQFCVEIQKT